ncbi:MAG: ATP-binding cassette domain-containing protein [Thermoplasmatota archaeon]
MKIEKKLRCPNCKKVSKFLGNPGEILEITCPHCSTKGKIALEDPLLSTKNTIISVKNISKKYKDVLAVHNVSFTINKGEIFGYIGPNGAGKTTTIKMMIGLLHQTSGEISINGLQMPKQKEQAHRFIGYMPQYAGFQQWRTVNQALLTFGKLSGVENNVLQQRIDEALHLLGLMKYKNKKISKLSGGTIQKVGIAQALLHNPSLLILDEPLSGLDPDSRYQVKKILKQLSNNGTTVFFSSHILSDLQDIASKICIIDWGKMIKIGSLNDLKVEFSKENQIEIIFSKKTDEYKNIQKITAVKEIIEISNERYIIQLDKNADSDAVTNEIITMLMENNCMIRSITPVSPSLDEMYQYYLRKGG